MLGYLTHLRIVNISANSYCINQHTDKSERTLLSRKALSVKSRVKG